MITIYQDSNGIKITNDALQSISLTKEEVIKLLDVLPEYAYDECPECGGLKTPDHECY